MTHPLSTEEVSVHLEELVATVEILSLIHI